jgi:hypothetical protein
LVYARLTSLPDQYTSLHGSSNKKKKEKEEKQKQKNDQKNDQKTFRQDAVIQVSDENKFPKMSNNI